MTVRISDNRDMADVERDLRAQVDALRASAKRIKTEAEIRERLDAVRQELRNEPNVWGERWAELYAEAVTLQWVLGEKQ